MNGIDAMKKNSCVRGTGVRPAVAPSARVSARTCGIPRHVAENAHAYEFLQSLYEILRSSLSTTKGMPMTTLEIHRLVPTPIIVG